MAIIYISFRFFHDPPLKYTFHKIIAIGQGGGEANLYMIASNHLALGREMEKDVALASGNLGLILGSIGAPPA